MRLATCLGAVAVLWTAACSSEPGRGSSRDYGTGLNTVDRTYGKPATEVWDSAVSAVKSYDLKVESDRHDSLGGELIARRGDGQKVTIGVRSLDNNNSNMTVRVEPGDRNMANLLHERTAEKLGLGKATSGLFGGNSVDGTYTGDLTRAVAAAERTYNGLSYAITQREVHGTWAQVDAREADSNPLRIKVESTGDAKVKANFIAGSSKSDHNKATAEKLKREFEKHMVAQGN